MAVQVAKAIGARVLATARGSDAALVEQLGASAVIAFEREDDVDAVNRLTEGGLGGSDFRHDRLRASGTRQVEPATAVKPSLG
ncbi:zinc-binding dehydrogenase [Methylorubrum podarium]|uniref:Zinc-binding dehydrogenase n=1 Tax=Methylorubrum podarium TaxID=200476 RepID=A0ABV1QJ18_9HYPH